MHHFLRVGVGQGVGRVQQQRIVQGAVRVAARVGVEGAQRVLRHAKPFGGLPPGQPAAVGCPRQVRRQRQGIRQRLAVFQADGRVPDLVFRRFAAAGPIGAQDGPAAVGVLAHRVGHLLVGRHPQAVCAAGDGQCGGAVGILRERSHAVVAAGIAGTGGQQKGVGTLVIDGAVPLQVKGRGIAVLQEIRCSAESVLRLPGQHFPIPYAAAGAAGRFQPAAGRKAGQIVGRPHRRQAAGILPGLGGHPAAETADRGVCRPLLGQPAALRHQRLHTAGGRVVAVAELHRVNGRPLGQRRRARLRHREGQPQRLPCPAAGEGKALHPQPGQVRKGEAVVLRGLGGVRQILRRDAAGRRGSAGIPAEQRRRQRVGVLQAGVRVGVSGIDIAGAGGIGHSLGVIRAAGRGLRLRGLRRDRRCRRRRRIGGRRQAARTAAARQHRGRQQAGRDEKNRAVFHIFLPFYGQILQKSFFLCLYHSTLCTKKKGSGRPPGTFYNADEIWTNLAAGFRFQAQRYCPRPDLF